MQVTLAKKGNAYEKTKLNCRFQHRVSAGLGPTKLNIDTEYETTESSSGGGQSVTKLYRNLMTSKESLLESN